MYILYTKTLKSSADITMNLNSLLIFCISFEKAKTAILKKEKKHYSCFVTFTQPPYSEYDIPSFHPRTAISVYIHYCNYYKEIIIRTTYTESHSTGYMNSLRHLFFETTYFY